MRVSDNAHAKVDAARLDGTVAKIMPDI
jgi:hypothetical protein